jgi:hypothetical protein
LHVIEADISVQVGRYGRGDVTHLLLELSQMTGLLQKVRHAMRD